MKAMTNESPEPVAPTLPREQIYELGESLSRGYSIAAESAALNGAREPQAYAHFVGILHERLLSQLLATGDSPASAQATLAAIVAVARSGAFSAAIGHA